MGSKKINLKYVFGHMDYGVQIENTLYKMPCFKFIFGFNK